MCCYCGNKNPMNPLMPRHGLKNTHVWNVSIEGWMPMEGKLTESSRETACINKRCRLKPGWQQDLQADINKSRYERRKKWLRAPGWVSCINIGQRLESRDHPTSQILSLRSALTPELYSVQCNLSPAPLPAMTESEVRNFSHTSPTFWIHLYFTLRGNNKTHIIVSRQPMKLGECPPDHLELCEIVIGQYFPPPGVRRIYIFYNINISMYRPDVASLLFFSMYTFTWGRCI